MEAEVICEENGLVITKLQCLVNPTKIQTHCTTNSQLHYDQTPTNMFKLW
jgi:hypothetical protein